MPAPIVIKTVLISLSVAAALGIALYQNPQIQEWIEEQRRIITEWLSAFGDSLDPQTRREAEAFAYEGELPTRRESSGAANAVAVATGRDARSDAVTRRMQPSSSQSTIDVEERRRLGREYLARRNQDMLDRQQQDRPSGVQVSKNATDGIQARKVGQCSERKRSSSSFDQLVNDNGTLKLEDNELPNAPVELRDDGALQEAAQLIDVSDQSEKVAVTDRAMRAGARYANPFGDEFELSDHPSLRQETSNRPPVPPKIALDKQAVVTTPEVDNDSTGQPEDPAFDSLSFEEQLARALSLSLADSEAKARDLRAKQEEQDPDMAAAIAESLKHAAEHEAQDSKTVPVEPSDDELYTLSPALTHAQPAKTLPTMAQPYDPVREAAASHAQASPSSVFQSFESLSTALSGGFAADGSARQRLIDVETDTPAVATHPASSPNPAASVPHVVSTPSTASPSPDVHSEAESYGFATDSEADDFASLPSGRASRADSSVQSEASLVEVEDVDAESMSDDDDGIRTPGSWTDVGSDVGDSERSESDAGDIVRV